MKKAFFVVVIILILIVAWLGIRFVLGGPEDDWICDKGQWIRHGNPRSPKPTGSCGTQNQNPSQNQAQIANPASVYCKEQGGI